MSDTVFYPLNYSIALVSEKFISFQIEANHVSTVLLKRSGSARENP